MTFQYHKEKYSLEAPALFLKGSPLYMELL